MPAYPCVKCQTRVDTGGDGRCKKCGETRPFKCTKCDRQMSLLMVFQPEKLTFSKPLYCQECGPAAESVECRQCGGPLTRSNGVEVGAYVYHPECYEKQAKIYNTVRPVAMAAMVLICGYFGYMVLHNWITALLGAGAGVFVGMAIAKPFAPK